MDGLLIILTYLSSSFSLLLLFCVNLRAVWETASVGPPTWATQGQRGLMLLVKSAGTCSKQLFTPTLMCLCVHLRAIVWCFLLRTHWTHICVCLHSWIHTSRSTLWFLPLQAPSPSMLCDQTPAVQQSFNERSTWERRNKEQREEKDFMGLYFFFSWATCVVFRGLKRHSSAETCIWLWLELQSHCGHRRRGKKSDALARGGTHPNTLIQHFFRHFPYRKNKTKNTNRCHSMLPRREEATRSIILSHLLSSCCVHFSLFSVTQCACNSG